MSTIKNPTDVFKGAKASRAVYFFDTAWVDGVDQAELWLNHKFGQCWYFKSKHLFAVKKTASRKIADAISWVSLNNLETGSTSIQIKFAAQFIAVFREVVFLTVKTITAR